MKKVIFVILVLFFFLGNVNAQKGKMAVGGQVGLSFPMGDFGDLASMGWGFIGNYFYGVTPEIDLTGTIGYYSWGGDVEGTDLSFSDVPVIVGARYYFQRAEFTPYGMADLGLHFMSGGFTYVNPFTGQSTTVDNSNTEFGLGLGGGFLYNIGEMMLDVNLKFNIISESNHFTLMAGVKYPLK